MGSLSGQPPGPGPQGNSRAEPAASNASSMKEIDPTDWQSVVKGMLSIHLPSSHLQPHPINTASAHQDTFTASNSFKTLASYVSGPELESLQSGSPKASRSPMGMSSPRGSGGLLLVRIDESEALDTSSDCGDTASEMQDSMSDVDQFFRQVQIAPRIQSEPLPSFRRSRLAPAGSTRLRSSATGGEELEGEATEPLPPLQSSDPGFPSNATAGVSLQVSVRNDNPAAKTRCVGSVLDTREGKGISVSCSGGTPTPPHSSHTEISKGAPPSLSKYHPDAPALSAGNVSVGVSGAGNGKPPPPPKIRRSIVQRISDHGCDDDEHCRLEFEEDKLKRDVSDCTMKCTISRRASDSLHMLH